MRIAISLLAVVIMLACNSAADNFGQLMHYSVSNRGKSEIEEFAGGELCLESFHNALTDFAPDGKAVYLTRSNQDFTSTSVLISRLVRGRWSEPEAAFFSDGRSDTGASLTPDGSRLFFTSKRPVASEGINDEWNIWAAQRNRHGWQKPAPMPRPVNSERSECCATAKAKGVIYFSSDREGSWDIYRAELSPSGARKVEKLTGGINTKHGEWPSYIDPAERFLIFSSIRPEGHGGDDIYISYREGKGWSAGKNLGSLVNSKGYEDSAILSPERKHLIFSSRRESGFSRIYRIRLEHIKEIKL